MNFNETKEAKNWVVQSNHFGNVIEQSTTVSQQKMVAIYISKLNPKSENTRRVTLSLRDYERIMRFKRYNITKLKEASKELVRLPVCIDKPDGGFITMPVFNKFELYQDKNLEWYIDIDCSEYILPYLFELKKEFYKFELWNILRLREKNHQQMYRLLKMAEKLGARTITIERLKLCLGLENSKYEFKEFNRRVLKGCQQALKEHTDIEFTYEPIRKGRSVHAIKFCISRNESYTDQLSLEEYIEEQVIPEVEGEIESFYVNEHLSFLSEACSNEFNEAEMQVLYDLITKVVPYSSMDSKLEQYNYLLRKYNELKLREAKKNLPPVNSKFGYIRTIIAADSK